MDLCEYQLVDNESYYSVQDFGLQYCNVGYDQCASLRDDYNYTEGYDRYFCAEGVNYELLENDNDSDDYDYYN